MIKQDSDFENGLMKTPKLTKHSLTKISEIFSQKRGTYINEFMLFIAHYDSIPNLINEIKIDCKKARAWFENKYELKEEECYYSKRYFNDSKNAEIDDIFYFLYEDLIVDFDTNSSIVRFLFRKTALSKVEDIAKGIKKFKVRIPETVPKIILLVESPRGLETIAMRIVKPKLSIQDNYNEDFQDTHKKIITRLSRKNDKGLVLLHGKPGTGKTSYIRYLIASLKKRVIFLPPNLVSTITAPRLLPILVDNPNSVLVIEDAENIMVDRQRDGHSPVSTLLNISDGLLADCLNVQIICTFNTDISKIDSALLRKGRLIAKYEFGALALSKAQALSDKLGFKNVLREPMTLTSIYNQDEQAYEQKSSNPAIGFQAINGRRLIEN